MLLLTMLGWGLVACAPTGSEQQTANGKAEQTQAVAVDAIGDGATAKRMRIAAAANLAEVLPKIIVSYQAAHPQQQIDVTYGSSGKLYAQIIAGAPYDLFLSADQNYALRLSKQIPTGGQAQQPFTYARGQLAIYSASRSAASLNESMLTQILKSQPQTKIAIANPELAPYGASAKAYLQQHQLYDDMMQAKRIIQAENVGQAFQYTHTASVDYGFVAQSQLQAVGAATEQFHTLPVDGYPPIWQDGLILSQSPAAQGFADYLRSKAGQQYLLAAGYLLAE